VHKPSIINQQVPKEIFLGLVNAYYCLMPSSNNLGASPFGTGTHFQISEK
jgi:hypothetical protein